MNDAVRIMQKWRRARLVKDEYFSLVQDCYLTKEIAAMRMGISVMEFENLMKEWQELKNEKDME